MYVDIHSMGYLVEVGPSHPGFDQCRRVERQAEHGDQSGPQVDVHLDSAREHEPYYIEHWTKCRGG